MLLLGAGTEGSSSAEILQSRVNSMSKNFSTLNERISFIENSVPFKFQNVENVDFNDFVTPGKFIVTSIANNNPSITSNTTTGFLEVIAEDPISFTNSNNFRWIVQNFYPIRY
jgi:hypothetical protein